MACVLAASARVACPAARPALPRVRGVLTSRDAEFPECRACCRIRRSARAAVACTSVCPSPCRGPPPLDWLKRGLDPLRDRLSQVDALYLWRRISHVRNPERWRRQVLGARFGRTTRVRQHDERRRWRWHNDERPRYGRSRRMHQERDGHFCGRLSHVRTPERWRRQVLGIR